jgi:4-hydroxybenzoyl-CoA reductase subunit alpha
LEYHLPTTIETPEIETILVEPIDPEGPYGAKEAGEGPQNPIVPAIVNAVYQATGVRFDETPLSADKVFAAMHKKANQKEMPISVPNFRFPEPERPTPREYFGERQ